MKYKIPLSLAVVLLCPMIMAPVAVNGPLRGFG